MTRSLANQFCRTLAALTASVFLIDAASAAEGVIEEVIVTAQKRAQDIVEVPTAITVFDSEDIKDASFSELGDIGEQTANLLTIARGTSTGSPLFVIRGVTSESAGNAGFSPPLGIYVDEVFMGRDRAFNQILNDIERIEVLKGPQGTLFGRNTTGGAISLTTRKPTDTFDLSADVTYGVDDLLQFRGSVGGPVIDDTLLMRLSLVSKTQDGYLYNPTRGEDLNESEEYGGRLIAVVNATERLRFEFSGDYYELDNNPAMETVSSVLPVPYPVIPDDRKVLLDQDEFYTREMWGASARMDYDFDEMTLTAIGGYRDYETTALDDSDGKPTYEFVTGRDEDSENYSLEVRLASSGDERFDWLAGFYYFYEDVQSVRPARIGSDFPVIIFAQPLGGLLAPIPPGEEELALTPGTMETDSYAAFGQVEYDFTDRLTLFAGLRYTYEEKEGTFSQTLVNLVPTTLTLFPIGSVPPIPLPGTVLPILFTPTPYTTDEITDEDLSGNIGLRYAVTPEATAYIKYSRGFKAGGFNLDVISPPNTIATQFAFEPETVDNYEAGFKARLFDDRLSLGIAAFYLEFDDKQERIVNLSSFFVTNAAAAEIYGLELEFTAYPLPRLSVFGNVGLLDSEYTEFPASLTTPSFTGNELSFAPNVSGSLNAQYVLPLEGTGSELFFRAGVDYVDNFYSGPGNSTVTEQDDVTLVNARIGWRASDQRWEVYAWGKNLTDEDILGTGTNVITITTRTINRGLEWGLEVRYNLF
jgi:iron complex outermembrane receptor protein